MKADYIREALHAPPFRPFTLHIAEGKSVHVPHPDFIAVSERVAVVISPPGKKPSIVTIAVPMITQLEVEGAPANGDEE